MMNHFQNNDSAPHILLVNPWIHDFAAYDVWAKPYGLLSLGAMLRSHDLNVSYIDCLDRFHPRAKVTDPHARHGRGPFLKTPIASPKGLERIKRTYSRYGIDPQWFRHDLSAIKPPDLILVTSLMTYWYPGVFETIAVIKSIFPAVPLVLGGIYARLCTAHARAHSGADRVVTDKGESLLDLVQDHTGYEVSSRFEFSQLDAWPYPAFDLQHRINYIPILTTRGCPFDCVYCASGFLEPRLRRRSPAAVVEEIAYWHHQYGVIDFAFYDDALLLDAETHAIPMLEMIVAKSMPVSFHTPNAIHIRALTAETARLMRRAGFHTLRLGLETMDFDVRSHLDCKVTRAEFGRAVRHLQAAGFDAGQIGAYLMVGLPGQSVSEVEASIREVRAAGITPVLTPYSPIPHTPLWEAALSISRYELAADPIFTNNTIFPCQREEFSWQSLSRLKQLASGEP